VKRLASNSCDRLPFTQQLLAPSRLLRARKVTLDQLDLLRSRGLEVACTFCLVSATLLYYLATWLLREGAWNDTPKPSRWQLGDLWTTLPDGTCTCLHWLSCCLGSLLQTANAAMPRELVPAHTSLSLPISSSPTSQAFGPFSKTPTGCARPST
jgi:hypothetical protein